MGVILKMVDVDDKGRVGLTRALREEREELTASEGYIEVAEDELATDRS